jgi:hypothetical protein
MITRRFVLTGLVAAPAVIAADKLMMVHSLPERYATVYGVGWDLEVIEHPIWQPMSVAYFGGTPAIDQFREVTAFVHAFPVVPLGWSPHNSGYLKRYGTSYGIPAETISTAAYGKHAVAERTKQIAQWHPETVRNDGFTRLMGFDEIDQWREAQRPDLDGRFSDEWVQEQLEGYRKFGGEPSWLTDSLRS